MSNICFLQGKGRGRKAKVWPGKDLEMTYKFDPVETRALIMFSYCRCGWEAAHSQKAAVGHLSWELKFLTMVPL